MVQRAINAKAKAGLRSIIMVRDSDIYYSQGHCLFNNTASKVQTQGTTAKNFSHLEEPKIKDPKSVLLRNNPAEPVKKKDKQKKFKRRQKCTRESKKTPATSDNTIDAAKKKKKCDTNKIICFNCNKQSHYASDYTELKN